MSVTQKLYLASKDKKLFGVCGGLAKYLGVDATVIRLSWTLITLFSGIVPGTVAYLLAAMIIPVRPTVE